MVEVNTFGRREQGATPAHPCITRVRARELPARVTKRGYNPTLSYHHAWVVRGSFLPDDPALRVRMTRGAELRTCVAARLPLDPLGACKA